MTPGQRAFNIHASAWGAVNGFIFMVWLITGAGFPWFLFPAGGWGAGLAIHAAVLYTKGPDDDDELESGDGQPQLGYRS